MTYRTTVPALALALAGLVAHPAVAAAAVNPSPSPSPSPSTSTSTSTSTVAPSVQWKPCPSYSDEVARALGATTEAKLAAFRGLMKRLECGTVSVPLNHGDPAGRRIDIAVTRLAATDRARRLGAISILPGGPGGSGYLDAVLRVVPSNERMAGLNERYDLIGFDPRGVGYSTKVACVLPMGGPAEPGPLTKETARTLYDAQVAANQECAGSDPAFIGQLTTENVARDLDLVRAALGESRFNLLGFSWGTYLGMAYRSRYPGRTGRAFLDSVAPPVLNVEQHAEGYTEATERNFGRMAAWLAGHDGTYGLGATAREVREQVAKLIRAYDRSPRTYSDLQRPVDGSVVADLAARASVDWARAGKALAELRTATGATAPPTVKELIGAPMTRTPVPGMPELSNGTMNLATVCNEDSSRAGFDSAWSTYQQILRRYPVTGRAAPLPVLCSGWPLPVQRTTLRRSGGSLVLAGHLYEFMSPYEGVLRSWHAVGGTVYTVADDVHVSATRVAGCAADVARYFETGRIGKGCAGMPSPS
ncbi:alpha/beta hydrolase [Actinomadura sp. ATCC 31491]|uniref:Alpha/beta hydrolase n=1 Tax=Actinomadura luzonensis TaxID=2805427 RepID=A0ABT0FY58_9ACTN|nr:alpha/beta fold hydrolase [Actinomadura luzonensis]MCK2217240.1 alpha/beta hydrolase [Actinomadura luzonensis]